MKTGVNVIDAMTKQPVEVTPDTSIRNCTKFMLSEQVGSVVVKHKDQLLGIVTEKDIVQAVAEEQHSTTPVKNIMETKLISITPNKDLYEAITTMKRHKVRRLPVIDKGKLLGLLTQKDILKIEPQLFDLLAEKIQLREEKDKAPYFKGRCEQCEKLAKLTKHQNQMVCATCQSL